MKKIEVKKLTPMPGYVLVEPAEKEAQTSSGIIIPTDNSEKPQYGKILAMGEACSGVEKCECGCSVEVKEALKVGDTVIYKKWGGNDVKIDDTEYQFLKYEDILAKVA